MNYPHLRLLTKIYKRSLLIHQNSLKSAKNVFATISVSKGAVSLLIEVCKQLIVLANKICKQKAEKQTIKLKSAQTGCTKRLYDTLGSKGDYSCQNTDCIFKGSGYPLPFFVLIFFRHIFIRYNKKEYRRKIACHIC